MFFPGHRVSLVLYSFLGVGYLWSHVLSGGIPYLLGTLPPWIPYPRIPNPLSTLPPWIPSPSDTLLPWLTLSRNHKSGRYASYWNALLSHWISTTFFCVNGSFIATVIKNHKITYVNCYGCYELVLAMCVCQPLLKIRFITSF